ncbi:MAG: oligosaccharide flippase family protein [Alphaproteobacteria bacterium]|nr:oligosaccharide flippase family protein [Alphaproteobacteria bacterium]
MLNLAALALADDLKIRPLPGRIGDLLMHRGSFTGDAFVILAGSGAAKLIVLASMPFITRLYGASDYGVWVIVLTLASFLIPLATMRYDLAVVLAPTRRIAAALVLAIGVFTLAVAIGAALILLWTPSDVLKVVTGLAADRQNILVLVPLVVVVLASQAALQAWATREHQFVALSLAALVQAVVTAAAFLLLPLLLVPNAEAAASAAILGLLSGQVTLTVSGGTGLFVAARQRLLRVAAFHGLRRYKVYAFYVVPYSLSAGITERVIQLVLASAYSLGTLGAFFVARQIMSAPAMLLGNTLRQVLFAHAARQDNRQETKQRVGRILKLVVTLLMPAMGFGLIWLKPAVTILLGDRWPLLPEFAWWLLFMGGSLLLIAGLDRIFDVLGQQRVSVALRIGSDLLLIGATLVSLALGVGPVSFVATISLVSTLTNLVSLWVVLRLLGFDWREITALPVRLVAGITFWGATNFGLDSLDLGLTGFVVASALLVAALAPAILKTAKSVRLSVGQSRQSASTQKPK